MQHARRLVVLVCLTFACGASDAPAWNHTGHRASALIAWRNMTPAAQAEAVRLLRAHPRYREDLLSDMPAGYERPELWAFMTAATWPDIIRDEKHPMHKEHHKGPWHYVDWAYAPDGDRRSYRDGPPDWGLGTEPLNVLQGIRKAEADLADASLPDARRAVMLCWFLHLVSDLHQPLHSTSLVNADFPEGDRGGNSTLVSYGGEAVNLHALWDNRVGKTREPGELAALADRVTGDHPRPAMAAAALPATPAEVAVEGRRLAVTYAYLHGHLPYTRRGPDGNLLAPAPDLPPGYDEASAAVARRRVAQGGYRMGESLSRLFDPRHTPATAPTTAPAPGPGQELLRQGK